jgi:hypothetical protein
MAPRTVDSTYIADAVAAFTRTGFHGPLNYYRAVDPFTRHSAAFAGAKIRQPSMFLAGTLDRLNLVAQPSPESMRSNLTDLRRFTILESVGHWPQLEAHDTTNAAMLAFLPRQYTGGAANSRPKWVRNEIFDYLQSCVQSCALGAGPKGSSYRSSTAEAAGERSGLVVIESARPELKLLFEGDSTMVGVGVRH